MLSSEYEHEYEYEDEEKERKVAPAAGLEPATG